MPELRELDVNMLKTKRRKSKENELKNSFYLYNGVRICLGGSSTFCRYFIFFKNYAQVFPCIKNPYMLVGFWKYYLDAESLLKKHAFMPLGE